MKKKRNTWIPVVAGILKKDSKVLLGLRPQEKSLPGVWEFPGGKIENGESPEEALKRELREELGIQAEIGNLSVATTHTYGDIGILLLFYQVPFWKGEPKTVHHNDLKWMTLGELENVDLPEANKKVLDKICASISGE